MRSRGGAGPPKKTYSTKCVLDRSGQLPLRARHAWKISVSLVVTARRL